MDLDGATIEQARRNAQDAGVDERVSFHVADAAGLEEPGHRYELVCLFDTLHELSRPVEALRACRALKAPAGAVLVLESRVAEAFRVPADEIERFQYATSVLHCLPAGLVGDSAVGTGTVMRPAVVRAIARDAGFGTIRGHDLENDRFHRLYQLAD
jgi:2-polyprenyl-3-methyl-5-hydroxy-6-metoxy-1,4-benzoquinol methylase